MISMMMRLQIKQFNKKLGDLFKWGDESAQKVMVGPIILLT